ncbi:MAG: DUF4912 domain-containing protein [Omnitrophica bacterium]|nr:DUF4912 domain-containing protein [Candidatus Omnitrophota bacterium]
MTKKIKTAPRTYKGGREAKAISAGRKLFSKHPKERSKTNKIKLGKVRGSKVKKIRVKKILKKISPVAVKKNKAFNRGMKKGALFLKSRKFKPAKRSVKRKAKSILNSAGQKVIVDKKPPLEDHELPLTYNITNIKLLVKDPFWIYAYWEISASSIESLRKNTAKEDIGKAKITLRIYDVTLREINVNNADSYFDIEVSQYTGNWYIKLRSDCACYIVDIGLKLPEGRFFTLARSNYVQIPPRGYSGRTEQIWMEVPDKNSEPIHTMARLCYYERSKVKPQIKAIKTVDITEEDIKHYYSNLNSSLKDIIASRISGICGTGEYLFFLEGGSDWEREKLFSWLPEDFFMRRIRLEASQELVIFGQRETAADIFSGGSDFLQNKAKKNISGLT